MSNFFRLRLEVEEGGLLFGLLWYTIGIDCHDRACEQAFKSMDGVRFKDKQLLKIAYRCRAMSLWTMEFAIDIVCCNNDSKRDRVG